MWGMLAVPMFMSVLVVPVVGMGGMLAVPMARAMLSHMTDADRQGMDVPPSMLCLRVIRHEIKISFFPMKVLSLDVL
jgi:hypothetical protein